MDGYRIFTNRIALKELVQRVLIPDRSLATHGDQYDKSVPILLFTDAYEPFQKPITLPKEDQTLEQVNYNKDTPAIIPEHMNFSGDYWIGNTLKSII